MDQRTLPKVTAVIPTIRHDRWLDEAIDSVLNQQGVDLQLIVILDGPVSLSERSWQEDEKVVILQNDSRQGVGSTLRTAVKSATGDYIARLDSDDLALPGRFMKQAEYLEENTNTVAVSCLTNFIDEAGQNIGSFKFSPTADTRKELLFQNTLVQSAMMFRNSAYESAGGYFPLMQMEDYHLWLRMGRLGKIAILQENLVSYRIHRNQISSGARPYGEHIELVLRERKNLAKALQKNSINQIQKNLIWRTFQFARFYVINPFKKIQKSLRGDG